MAPRIIRPSKSQPVGSSTSSSSTRRKIGGIDISDAEAKRFGINPYKQVDAATARSIINFREASQIADEWLKDKDTPPVFDTNSITGGGGGGGGSSSGGGAFDRILRNYVTGSLGNIGSDLTSQQTALNNLRSGTQTRYNDYLAKLNQSITGAQGNINTATQALLASIPQQATARQPLFQQPAAMSSNVYADYLRSIGMSAPEVASQQQFTNEQVGAANTLAQNAAAASTAAQQQYLDSLRNTATMAGTAAQQRLAAQVPAYQIQALSTLGANQAKIDEAIQKAQSGAATSRQSTLDALLPILLQYPSATNDVMKAFGLPTSKPKSSKNKGKDKGKK